MTTLKRLSQDRPASYLPLRTTRVREPVSALQAVQRAPSLAALAHIAKQSADCLRLVTPLIPVAMRAGIQAGPLQQHSESHLRHNEINNELKQATEWCLLAANSAIAAKLRQLAPALAAHLRTHGYDIQEIRIKIAMRSS